MDLHADGAHTLGRSPGDAGDRAVPLGLDRIEGYEVLGQLGHGADTVVLRVRRGDDPTELALKTLLRPPSESAAAGALWAMRREAALLGSVGPPAVPAVHEVGALGTRPYLVMELVDGRPLAELLEVGPLAEAQVLAVGLDVARGLQPAHRIGLVHRDVKPQNLLVSEGRARLIDLGLAARSGTTEAEEGAAGTFAYSAPEQTGMLARPVDARADLYALGVVLFECATGRPPFVTDDVGELLRQHAVTAAPDVRQLRPELSEGLAAVIARLLAKDPDDRPQSAVQVVSELAAVRSPGEAEPEPSPDSRLAGRAGELDRLESTWRRTVGGHGTMVAVRGPSGVGKTALVREFIDRRLGEGTLVLAGRCPTHDAAPLAPLRAALDRAVTRIEGADGPRAQRRREHLRRAAGDAAGLLAAVSPRLGEMLDAPRLPDQDRQEQLTTAVVDFLVELARLEGGLLLSLADADGLDPLTGRVLARLAGELGRAPMLVVLTSRAAGAATAADPGCGEPAGVPDPVERAVGAGVVERLDLEGLSLPGVEELLTQQLGMGRLPEALGQRLAVRTGGSPFTILEYLRALVDEGALWPSWGRWILDESALDRLDLPQDVVGVVLSRIDDLSEHARRLLATAAVQGSPFDVELVAAATDSPPSQVAEAVTRAMDLRLVEARASGHAFLHQEVPLSLLAGLTEAEEAELHHRVAEAMTERGEVDGAAALELARHRIAAGVGRAPHPTAQACLTAGRLALEQQAPADAARLLAAAVDATHEAGQTPSPVLRHDLARAWLRAGDVAECERELLAALEVATDPVGRAELQYTLAAVCAANVDGERMLATLQAGLAELGKPWPRNPVLLALTSLARLVAGVVLAKVTRDRGTVNDRKRRAVEMEVHLLGAASQAAVVSFQDTLGTMLLLRSVLPVCRLGRSPARPRALAGLGYFATFAGARGLGARLFAKAYAESEEQGDPMTIAQTAWVEGMVAAYQERPGKLERALENHGRWMDVGDYNNCVASLSMVRCSQGYAGRAQHLLRGGWERLQRDADAPEAFGLVCPGAHASALLGDPAEATRQVRLTVEAIERQEAPTVEQRFYAAWTVVNVLLEQGDLGDRFDRAVETLEAIELPSTNAPRAFACRAIMLARLEQAQAATTDDERALRLGQARAARKRIGLTLGKPALGTAVHLGRAWEAHLRGRERAATRRLARAQALLDTIDFPSLAYELARLRARMLATRGEELVAGRHARTALLVAEDEGWRLRARELREEFGILDAGPSGSARDSTRSVAASGTSHGAQEPLLERRLSALQEVSAAAATVLDPDELTRVALDVTIRLLAAERAFLFLVDPEDEHAPLKPYRGRDAHGAELRELTGYSSTLVERVHVERDPMVVTGSEHGAALGSESAVVHGLRSILIAPLQLKGRLLGVVYLDSRVARGIFSDDDVEVLAAITNHVAAALETARAARLEVAVRSEREQRHLAETLRASVSELTATLDGDEVLDRLLARVAATVGGERACLLREDAGELVLAGTIGAVAPGAGLSLDLRAHQGLQALLAAAAPTVGGRDRLLQSLPEDLDAVLGSPRSWLAVPIVARDRRVGLILAGTEAGDAYGPVEVDVAASLAEQGALAHENARLFAQVHSLATIDELTGLPNRRHLWEQAGRQVETARRDGGRLAALMLDIDHFKQVNDTHGHAVGDEVLRVVAARMATQLRASDLLGRYGGEEFTALLPTSDDPAALAERLRAAVAADPVTAGGVRIEVTISVGVSEFGPDDDLDTLLAKADAALYRAKESGRNRVVVA